MHTASPDNHPIHKVRYLTGRGLLKHDFTIASILRTLAKPLDEPALSRQPHPPSALQLALRERRWPSRIGARNLGVPRERYLALLRGQGNLSADQEAHFLLIVRAFAASAPRLKLNINDPSRHA